jgi:hypothetical protein
MIVVTIGALGFTIYTYFNSKDYRQLAYCVRENRAPILTKGGISDLQVTYKGRVVDSDITAVQITIWNNGTLPIKPENILRPVVLKIPSG